MEIRFGAGTDGDNYVHILNTTGEVRTELRGHVKEVHGVLTLHGEVAQAGVGGGSPAR